MTNEAPRPPCLSTSTALPPAPKPPGLVAHSPSVANTTDGPQRPAQVGERVGAERRRPSRPRTGRPRSGCRAPGRRRRSRRPAAGRACAAARSRTRTASRAPSSHGAGADLVQPAQVAGVGGHRPGAVGHQGDHRTRCGPVRGAPHLDAAAGERLVDQVPGAGVGARPEAPAPGRPARRTQVATLAAWPPAAKVIRAGVSSSAVSGPPSRRSRRASRPQARDQHRLHLSLAPVGPCSCTMPPMNATASPHVSSSPTRCPTLLHRAAVSSRWSPRSSATGCRRRPAPRPRGRSRPRYVAAGPVPATVAVVDGAVRVGLVRRRRWSGSPRSRAW